MVAQVDLVGRVLGHYRLVERIGAGGMGVVYRAHDEQLDRDVALKVLPPGTLHDDAARQQFRKEALALAKVSHPNIATVFEFGSQDGTDFLAMELIPGQSLSERVKEGPLSQQEVIRLATQLAEGLAAAHEQGVIHRDLKPANLFITPDGRLKILDFGLAKLVRAEAGADLTLSLSASTAAVVGTVPYMSPEQLRGLPADPRTDVYAMGAVLYEMATGSRPFPQTNGPELMGAILHVTPRPPRSLNPHVSPGLDSVVSKSMDKEPSQRYQSARELRIALDGLALGVSATGTPPPPEPGPRKSLIAGGFVLGVVLLAGAAIGFIIYSVRNRAPQPERAATANGNAISAAAVRPRHSVAVLGFKNVSGQPDKAWLSTALAEMLTTELGAGEALRTVAGEDVAQMKASLSLPDADSYSRETLAKIRANLNADNIVVGSFIPLGKDQIRLDLRLQDAAAGEILASVSEKGGEDQIDDIVSRAGAELREKLGVGAVSTEDAAAVRATLPSNAEAVRLYAEGLSKLHARDALAAFDPLQRSIALDPKFAQAHSALSSAWTTLGYDARAVAEARLAFDLSGNLGREDRLSIEARYREATHDWKAAIAVYRTLEQFFPDTLEYGLRLATAQISAGDAKDALETLQQLRELPAPASGDPRIDVEEANARMLLSQWKEANEVAARAVTKTRASGARLLLGQALMRQGEARRYLNEFDGADASYREAEGVFAAAGDRFGSATANMGMGTTAYQRGDLAHARERYQQSLVTFRENGSQKSMATCLLNIAITYYDQGDLAGALKMYDEALRTYREIDDKVGSANALNSIANVLADKGDQAGAKAKYQQALAIFRETGDPFETAMTMGNIGELSLDQGDLPEARKMLEEALQIKRAIKNLHSQAYTLTVLGDLNLYQDDLAAARKMHEEALAIRTQLKEKSTGAQNSLALAGITLEEGHPDAALAAARQAAAVFQQQKQVEYEAVARELVARCLLQMGKAPEAKTEIQQAERLLAKSDNHAARLAVAITAARVATAQGEFAAAQKSLDSALAESARANLMYFQLDARLALGQLEIKSGKAAAGRARLTALAGEAKSKGFLLLARKAS